MRHRAVLSASRKLLGTVKNRIIVDHHRRAEDIISDTSLLYLEPSSSSTSELVTELICYFDDGLEITPGEATVLYSGIVLDTKNFAVQTGERTFEAGALLRRSGAVLIWYVCSSRTICLLCRFIAKLVAEAKTPIQDLRFLYCVMQCMILCRLYFFAQTADTLITINGIFCRCGNCRI